MSKIQEIEIEKIKEPQDAIRSVIEKEALEELAESIKERGLLQPLIVRPIEDGYEVVAGHRRLLACRMIGLEKVPCIVKELNDIEVLIERLHENIKREELNVVDQAELIHKLYVEGGYTFKEIGEIFGKSEGWARDHERIYFCDEFIKEALRAGHIKKSHAYTLMKHPDPERRAYFLRLCIENGASPKTLDLWIRDDLGVLHTLKEATPIQKISDLRRGAETVLFTCAICNGKAPGDAMYVIHVCPDCYHTIQEVTTWGKGASIEQEEELSGEPETS